MNIRGYLTLHLKILVRKDMDVNEHQGNIRGYLTLHLKILVRNDMDVNEHQGLYITTLKNISKERYGCK